MIAIDPSATKKKRPSIWVTWLSKLLSGDSHCEWALWFQSQYIFKKLPSDFDAAQWTAKHNALVRQRIAELEAEGFTVYIEDENKFDIHGTQSGSIVSGKPDIVAIRGDEAIVEDCKTGQVKNTDFRQVLIYMFLLPRKGGPEHCRGLKIEGRLIYPDETIDIPSTHIDENFIKTFREAVASMSSLEPARRVPSSRECRYCKVPTQYCDERIDEEAPVITGEDDLF